jgi:hypothetical protein
LNSLPLTPGASKIAAKKITRKATINGFMISSDQSFGGCLTQGICHQWQDPEIGWIAWRTRAQLRSFVTGWQLECGDLPLMAGL